MLKYLKRIGLEPFVLLLFFSILLAWLYPSLGNGTGRWSLSAFAHYGISVIFFFYGLRLDRQKIKNGLANYRLHLLVHLSTFVFFPLVVLAVMLLLNQYPDKEKIAALLTSSSSKASTSVGIWLGIFFLATLPSTVSSAVVMVNIAKGNLTAAIFDASVSSLMGVFLTPLWMRIFVTADSGGVALNSVIMSLIVQIVIPVGLGFALHRLLGPFSQKYDRQLRMFDESIILLIIYTSFCHSFAEHMFDGISLLTLTLLSAGMVLLFFTAWFIIAILCRIFKFNREDRITALFCGSKKSLVHGTVMSVVLLKNPALAGILLLPTMIYHALQLIIASIIATRMGKEKNC